MKMVARSLYARNIWAIMSKFNSFSPSEGIYQPMTNMQQNFIFEEMNVDAEERKRAAKGIDADESKQFFDNNTDWWDNPDEHDMFEDDPQSDEEFAKQFKSFLDADTNRKLVEKEEAVAAGMRYDSEADEREQQIQDELERRRKNVEELLRRGPQGVSEFKQHLRERERKAKESSQEEQTQSPEQFKKADISGNDAQSELARKTLERTKEALRNNKF